MQSRGGYSTTFLAAIQSSLLNLLDKLSVNMIIHHYLIIASIYYISDFIDLLTACVLAQQLMEKTLP